MREGPHGNTLTLFPLAVVVDKEQKFQNLFLIRGLF